VIKGEVGSGGEEVFNVEAGDGLSPCNRACTGARGAVGVSVDGDTHIVDSGVFERVGRGHSPIVFVPGSGAHRQITESA